ncbi:hypothetical protein [Citrobacter braakii]|uniref:hypothetical protein n=1 Tax=Citrobacter braakii TaxID=57706 RepID=UPI0037B0ECAB
MTATNKSMTGAQLDELMAVAMRMQSDSEKMGERSVSMFAYAVQVAVLEIRETRCKYAELQSQNADMAVQLANAESKCAALAAENAALKSGQLFFMHSDATGFEIHKTREAAIASAEDMLSDCREEASSEGWSEETGTICWGIIMQKAFEGEFEKPSESNGFIGWSEYSLQPTIEPPATDAFMAEVRASGVEMFGQYHNFSEKLFIQKEAQKFAAKLLKGDKS